MTPSIVYEPRCLPSGEWIVGYARPNYPGSFFAIATGFPTKISAEVEILKIKDRQKEYQDKMIKDATARVILFRSNGLEL